MEFSRRFSACGTIENGTLWCLPLTRLTRRAVKIAKEIVFILLLNTVLISLSPSDVELKSDGSVLLYIARLGAYLTLSYHAGLNVQCPHIKADLLTGNTILVSLYLGVFEVPVLPTRFLSCIGGGFC